MRRMTVILGACIGAALMLLWLTGGLDGLERWAAEGQRKVQNALAGTVRQLRAGEAGALAALLAASFGYGFFHAAGPGHGKVLIAGYGMGRRVSLWRLSVIAVLSSVAQGGTAILLVGTGALVLGWTREQMVGLAETVMAPLGYAAIALLGLWLMTRGMASLRLSAGEGDGPAKAHGAHPHHDHHPDHHHHDAACGCGHAHGPTPDDVARLTGWRDTLVLVAGIALRPCTGALFLLILTFAMGIGWAGILGTLAMAMGTASVTVLVAGLSVWAREGTLAALPGAGLARAMPVLEMLAGGAVAAIATTLMLRAL